MRLIISLLVSSTVAYAQTCYSMEGTANPRMKPCNSTGNPGACCDIDNGDICTSSGLCLRQDGTPGFFYQDSCTDASWGSTCPEYCKDKLDSSWRVIPCSDDSPGEWCCHAPHDKTNCCTNSSAIFTTNIGKLMLATLRPTATITMTANSTSTAVPTSDAAGYHAGAAGAAESQETCPKNNTPTVGAGVGASLGVALLASLALLGWREKTRPKTESAVAMDMGDQENGKGYYGNGNGDGVERSQLGVDGPPVQLEAKNPLFELPSSNQSPSMSPRVVGSGPLD